MILLIWRWLERGFPHLTNSKGFFSNRITTSYTSIPSSPEGINQNTGTIDLWCKEEDSISYYKVARLEQQCMCSVQSTTATIAILIHFTITLTSKMWRKWGRYLIWTNCSKSRLTGGNSNDYPSKWSLTVLTLNNRVCFIPLNHNLQSKRKRSTLKWIKRKMIRTFLI